MILNENNVEGEDIVEELPMYNFGMLTASSG